MNRLGVVGCGIMGSGIAEVGARSGATSLSSDVSTAALESAKAKMTCVPGQGTERPASSRSRSTL